MHREHLNLAFSGVNSAITHRLGSRHSASFPVESVFGEAGGCRFLPNDLRVQPIVHVDGIVEHVTVVVCDHLLGCASDRVMMLHDSKRVQHCLFVLHDKLSGFLGDSCVLEQFASVQL